jgi:hypothetical protein
MLQSDVGRVNPDVSKYHNIFIFSMKQSLTLNINTLLSLETSEIIYPTTQHNIPGDLKLQIT